MAGVTLLTPTGGRPDAFALCEKYIARQDYQGEVQWLVTDDHRVPTQCHMGQEVYRVEPLWFPGFNTQHRNLLVMLPLIKHDRVLIIEDDDWYAPSYISTMVDLMETNVLVGLHSAHYYNVASQLYRIHHNRGHASLCQTGFRKELIPLFRSICTEKAEWIDMTLWERTEQTKKLIPPGNPPLSVGIKGMPGRPGIGRGHHVLTSMNFKKDTNFQTLQCWLDLDADAYMKYYRNGTGT